MQERNAEVNRLQKTLETANIKLSAVVSDVTGVSARAMLRELAAGRTDAEALADLAVGPSGRHQLRQQRHRVRKHLERHAIDYLDGAIADLDTQIAERERPFEDAVERLDEIPGVGRRVAETVIAEVEKGDSVRRVGASAVRNSGLCTASSSARACCTEWKSPSA